MAIKLYMTPEQASLDYVTKYLRITFEPYLNERVLEVELSEEHILMVLEKVAREFNAAFKADTGINGKMEQVDKIVIKIGDHVIEAKEELINVNKTVSNGFKKING